MSYLEHFKLHSQPFSEHAARESLWEDARMQEGLSRLQHLVHSGLLGLVTGASGLGKSALLKRFMGEQSPQVCQTIYCHLAHGHRQSDQRSLSAQTAIEGANSSLHRLSGRSSRR